MIVVKDEVPSRLDRLVEMRGKKNADVGVGE